MAKSKSKHSSEIVKHFFKQNKWISHLLAAFSLVIVSPIARSEDPKPHIEDQRGDEVKIGKSNHLDFKGIDHQAFFNSSELKIKRGTRDAQSIEHTVPIEILSLELFEWQSTLAAVVRVRAEKEIEFRVLTFDNEASSIKSNRLFYRTSDERLRIISAIGESRADVVYTDTIMIVLGVRGRGKHYLSEVVIFTQGCSQPGDKLTCGTVDYLKIDRR